jgi:hypothetical protein
MAELDNKKLIASINDLLSKTDIKDITSESNSFQELPEGYYLCSVDNAELKESKASGNPMVAFTFTIVENGHQYVADKDGNVEMKDVKGSKNRKIFMYYVLKDTSSVRRFVSDMLKFEGEEKGKPLLDKEYFMNSELLTDALKILEGIQIYVQITKSTNDDGTTRSWQNIISWKRAAALDLPM